MKTLTKERLLEFLEDNRTFSPVFISWAKTHSTAENIIDNCPTTDLYRLIYKIGGMIEADFYALTSSIEAKYLNDIEALHAKNYMDDSVRCFLRIEYNNVIDAVARKVCTFKRVQEEIGD